MFYNITGKKIYKDQHSLLENTLCFNYKVMSNVFSDLKTILDKIQKKDTQNLSKPLQNLCDGITEAMDITSRVIENAKYASKEKSSEGITAL